MHGRSLAAPLAVAAAAAGGCAVIWMANPTVPGGILPICPTKALLGIDCPGCGSLRMIYSLLHLDVVSAVRFNALGLVAVLLLLWAYGVWVYGRLAGRKIRSWQHLRWSAPVALAVTLTWFVVRNLEFGPFVALHV
ncbi:MAG: hypothetical protein QOD39_1633 [Mycobacterium sp.]|jgi:hypothetical protein|nr:hypothetical protein [Mycobacterium sp.]